MTDTEVLYNKIQSFLHEDLLPKERSLILKALDEALQDSFDQGRNEGLDEGRAASNDFRFYIP